jgi:Zn-dependent oligopeptidase
MSLTNNPLIDRNKVGKHEAFPFDQFKLEHYLPAFETAVESAKKAIEEIKNSDKEATFDNTILAMSYAEEHLGEVASVFFNLLGAESDNEFKNLAQKVSPMLAQFHSEISLDPVIFEKIKYIYENELEGADKEKKRLIEKTYKSFVKNGALLPEEKKTRLKEISMELSSLSPKFSQNLLNATNAFELHITDEEELVGLPQSAKDAAAHTAKQKGKENGWMFTLQAPSVIPVMTYADNRELRKTITTAFRSRAMEGEFGNQDLLKKIANLRHEKAELLGFKTHAELTLSERMAQTPETVIDFLEKIFDVAMPAAKKETEDLKAFAAEKFDHTDFKSWDSGYYTNKMKKELFAYEEEELRPYFKLENVIDGIFQIADKLYGLKFEQVNDIPVYHEEVKTFEVTDADNNFVGLLYMDLHPRDTKRGGAWMTTFRGQGQYSDGIKRPHVAIVCNVTPSTDKAPSLLRFSEANTLFHEFGHALHALLSDCQYTDLASPNVYWDFVELPSQIFENWITETEALNLFAKHYETGEIIPAELVEKVKKVRSFMAGSANIRQLTFGVLDMAWHNADPKDNTDVIAFEDKVLEKYTLLPKDIDSCTSTAFAHIFAGGYSAGYYSYKWAEVLDADAFSLFLEKGIFDPETAKSFKDNILSKGNTEEPMDLFVKFRGRKPDPDALLKRDGLL